MDIDDIEPFLQRENERLIESLPGLTAENMPLAQTVKLSEEVGELSNAVLVTNGLQRPRDEMADSALAMELADVLITTMLLGETLGVDIENAVAAKMEQIDGRYE